MVGPSSSCVAPSNLLVHLNVQVVKEVNCIGGAQQKATKRLLSLDAGVLIAYTVKVFKKWTTVKVGEATRLLGDGAF